MKYTALALAVLFLSACGDGSSSTNHKPSSQSHAPYVLPNVITVEFSAERTDNGAIVIVGSTNLPDGTMLGAEIPTLSGRLGPQDFKIPVHLGRFRSSGFTNEGKLFPPGQHKVRLLAYFNGAWQSQDILQIVGDGGTKLKGAVIKPTDPDVIDSDYILDTTRLVEFPKPTENARAIQLVKRAILVVDGSRSATDIETNIELFMKYPGLSPGAEWQAKRETDRTYQVTYDFVNGDMGNKQAIWEVDVSKGSVRYVNKYAKNFSWTPNY